MNAPVAFPSTRCQLVVKGIESLSEDGAQTGQLHALLIELGQLVEVELTLQIARRILPLANPGLKLLLLSDKSYRVDTFVHTYGVLPVVAAMCILRLIHDTHGLRSTHVAQHHLLLHLTNLHTGCIQRIATLLNAIRRQIATSGTRITHNHTEVARLVAIHSNGRPRLGVIGHVVLRILGRTIGLGVGIDAEHAIVTRLTGPHPVVRFSTKLTHRLGNGKH